ncbi:MAG: hypothetical protein ACI8UX_000698 [Psychromonas sp.]|jgi:hypothetical protein
MGKTFYSLMLSMFFISLEGQKGEVRPAGQTGAAGTNGAMATARYFDVVYSWDGTTGMSSTKYTLPSFNPFSEYILAFVVMGDNISFKPLPIVEGAAINTSGTAKNVDMSYIYRATGSVAISERNYRDNGPQSFNIRVVVVPIIAGARISRLTSYEEVKKMYNL